MMRYFTTGNGLVDTNELRDDHTGRWNHLCDSHYSEESEYKRPLRKWEESENFAAYRHSADEREARFMRLSWWLERQRVRMISLRRRGKPTDSLKRTIERCAKGIKARYADSVRLVVTRGKNEWWLLYLKREQRDDLLTLARDAWLGR